MTQEPLSPPAGDRDGRTLRLFDLAPPSALCQRSQDSEWSRGAKLIGLDGCLSNEPLPLSLQVFPDGAVSLIRTSLRMPPSLSRSGRKLAPLGQCGRAVLLECCAGIQMTVVVEVIVDRSMNGRELL